MSDEREKGRGEWRKGMRVRGMKIGEVGKGGAGNDS